MDGAGVPNFRRSWLGAALDPMARTAVRVGEDRYSAS